MSDVFISYSRRDTPFAQRLFDELARTGRDSWVDWEDIPFSTEWWQEICAGIDGADTFLFIMSPDSLASQICNQELEYARRNYKRIVPVMHRDSDEQQLASAWFERPWEQTARDNWTTLKKLNWLFFREGSDFDQVFSHLIKTIEQDPEHVRFHTRTLVRARDWDSHQVPDSGLLLRGDDLRQAENWLTFNQSKVPPPTPLHIRYIQASLELRRKEEAAAARQRQRLRVLVAILSLLLIIAIGATGVAFNSTQIANDNAGTATIARGNAQVQATLARDSADTAVAARYTSEANATTAVFAQGLAIDNAETSDFNATQAFNNYSTSEANAKTATVAQGLAVNNAATSEANAATAVAAEDTSEANLEQAEVNLRQAWTTRSLFLAELSTQELRRGSPQNALLLAVESLEHYDDGIYNPVSYDALFGAMSSPIQEITFMHQSGGIDWVLWNADRTQILTSGLDGIARVWDAQSGELVLELLHDSPLNFAYWLRDPYIATGSRNGLISFWNRNTGELVHVLRHEGSANNLLSSHDQTRYLSYGADGAIRIWDAVTFEPLLLLRHTDTVSSANWSEDDSLILSVGRDGTARIWDTASGEELLNIPLVGSTPVARWSPDERRILAWDYFAAEVTVWDAETGEQLLRLPQRGKAGGAEWSDDGRQFITWTGATFSECNNNPDCENAINIYETRTGEKLLTMFHDDVVQLARWNADSSRILSYGDDYTARVWDAETGVELLRLNHDNPQVRAANWNEDETQITTIDDTTVRIWDVSNGQLITSLAHDVNVTYFTRDEASDMVLTWTKNNTIHLWKLSSAEIFPTVHHAGSTYNAWWSKDGKRVLSYDANGIALLWDTSNGNVLQRFEIGSGLRWSQDETRLLTWTNPESGCSRNCATEIIIWEVATGRRLLTIEQTDQPYYLRWTDDETLIYSQSREGDVHLWDAQTGEEVSSINVAYLPGASVSSEINLQNWRVVSGARDNRAAVHDIRTGELISMIEGPTTIVSVGFDPTATKVLTYNFEDSDPIGRVWDADTGQLLWELPLESKIAGGYFNKDGTRVRIWTQSGTAYIWNIQTGELLFRLENAGANGVSWNENETRLVGIDAAGSTRLWNAQTGELLLTLDAAEDEPNFGTVRATHWNQDETRLLVTYYDNVLGDAVGGVARIWDVQTGALLNTFSMRGDYISANWSMDETQILIWDDTGTTQVLPVDIETMLTMAQPRIIRNLSNIANELAFLPTLTPSITPVIVFPTSLATVTPLPTFEPTPSASPTLLPPDFVESVDVPFTKLIPGNVEGLQITSAQFGKSTDFYSEENAIILAPGEEVLIIKLTDPAEIKVVFIHETESPYRSVRAWRREAGYTGQPIIEIDGTEVVTVNLRSGSKIYAFIYEDTIVVIHANDEVDEDQLYDVVDALIQ